MKLYNNYEELEKDLEVHELKMSIAKEKMKLQFHELKQTYSRNTLVKNILVKSSLGFIKRLWRKKRRQRQSDS